MTAAPEKKNKIYTRKGDDGTTTIADSTAVAKTDPRVTASGDIDELNSNIGLLIAMMPDCTDISLLEHIQRRLFAVGQELQGHFKSKEAISQADTEEIEQDIDRISDPLPPLSDFILPGGTAAAAQCHVCRTVCRRAERSLIAASEHTQSHAIAYMNRLSDYLFALARHLNFIMKTEEKTLHKTLK